MKWVRANRGNVCVTCTVVDPALLPKQTGKPVVTRSVGRGGVNLPNEVLDVQEALNDVDERVGGPAEPLKTDGLVGKYTISAIEKFQKFHFPEKRADGRIDHDGWTIWRLKTVSALGRKLGGPGLSAFWTFRHTVRTARLHMTLPRLEEALNKAIATAEFAAMSLNGMPDSFGSIGKAYRLMDFYFALKGQSKPNQHLAIERVRDVFIRSRDRLRSNVPSYPGIPHGSSIFEMDPNNVSAAAYSPRQSNAAFGGQDPHKIFLCDPIDSVSHFHFLRVIAHEMAHMVDEETDAYTVTDHAYHDRIFDIPHHLRVQNADSYAWFLSHVHFGKATLMAESASMRPRLEKATDL
jgi:hypothetical protein